MAESSTTNNEKPEEGSSTTTTTITLNPAFRGKYIKTNSGWVETTEDIYEKIKKCRMNIVKIEDVAKWVSVSTIPYSFSGGGVIVLNNEIHLLGSSISTGISRPYTKYHYKYNTSTNTWSSVSTIPYDFYYGRAIVLNNEIHILGGSSYGKNHYKYNTSTNTWSSVSTIPYYFYDACAILLNNEIHILGSYGSSNRKYHYKYVIPD